jgi:hypothetical protein
MVDLCNKKKNNKTVIIHIYKKKTKNRRDISLLLIYVLSIHFLDGYLSIFLIIRYQDLVEILDEFDERFLLREKTLGIFDLGKLVIFIIYIAHLCGCFWHLLAAYELNN